MILVRGAVWKSCAGSRRAASARRKSSIRWNCKRADQRDCAPCPAVPWDGFPEIGFNVTVNARARLRETAIMKTRSGFFGVYPMVYALFDKRGNLARESTRRQVVAMLKHRVHGVAVLGLATEVNKLSTP